jgi:cytochrome c-type biogenesis protein CcmH/NrfG
MEARVVGDTEEEREFLVRSIADLDRELAAGDLDPTDATTLREEYERRLARLDEPVPPTPPRPGRTRRTLVVVALVALFGIGAGIAVSQMFGSRHPGDSLSGNIRESSADRLQRAAGLQDQGKFVDALKLYDEVIKSDPRNAEALAERGFLLLKLGAQTGRQDFVTQGQDYVARALRIEPDNPRWLVYRAMGLRVTGDDAGAEQAVEAALANDPPPDLKAVIESIRASASSTTTTTTP